MKTGTSWFLATVVTLCAVRYTTQLNTDQSLRQDGPHGNVSYPQHDDTEHQGEELNRRKRFMLNESSRRWPKWAIPYKWTAAIGGDENKKDIIAAMAFYEYLTPLRFEEWSYQRTKYLKHPGFIYYRYVGGRGYSLLGFYNMSQGQPLDCPRQRTCVHEIGHALGFKHEQVHPDRDRWININLPKVQYELDSWTKFDWGNRIKTNFDYSSFMLYPPNYNKEYDVLFPELFPFQQRPFYMFKEICSYYNCDQASQCINEQLVCANEGYVSVVDGKCSCVCLPGLDPDTGCTSIIRNGQGKWPGGTFSLLEHKDGCPDGYFREGTLTHYSSGDNRLVSPDFKGELSGHKAKLSFCTQTVDNGNGKWPPGSYCFFKKGSCPKQRGIYEGKIELLGDYTNYKDNTVTGFAPSGDTGIDPSMEYCCLHTGFPYMPINLPNDKPFILLVRGGQACQQVIGMSAKMEKFGLYSPRMFGDVSYEWDGRTALVYYCVYTPADRKCGDIVEMGPGKTTMTIESNQRNPANQECDWLFKTAPGAKGRFVLTFDEFDVPCTDYVEVQHTMVAQIGKTFCGNVKDKSIQSLYDKLRVQYKTVSNSKSHFKATVKWIPDSELCYIASLNGATYRGDVSYTRNFEKCLPWSEVKKCMVIPNGLGFLKGGLEGNTCRNPDNSFYPWCYTKLDGCVRDFCDVCQLEEPFDTASDCADRQRRGQCTVDSVDCAKTCSIVTQGPGNNVHPVTCDIPHAISGADLDGQFKSTFHPGDIMTYKCRKSGNTVKTVCQENGEWSTTNTACLPCPEGYTHFREHCYIFFDTMMKFFDALDFCSKRGEELALPSNQGENDFMHKFRYPLQTTWIGGHMEEKGYMDGSSNRVTWFNWRFYDVPHPNRCIYMRFDGMWHDTTECQWEMNLMCRKPVTDAEPECKDFLDNCVTLVGEEKDSNCDLKPGLDTYCRYTCGKCPGGCDQQIQLTQSNRQYVINADRSKTSSRYCTWNIKPPGKNGRLVLKFEEFDVVSNSDSCVDGVEVRSERYGPPFDRFCNAHYNKTTIVIGEQMLVRFIAPESSNSKFRAHVEWIPDEDMCYHAADKGWSYAGTVNYTRTFEECLSWPDVFHCENNTLWNGYFLENLDHNYCRNPRPEEHNEQPYCYTKDCVKKYCDVCHLEKPSDNSTDCQSFKRAGNCQSDPLGAATKCAETCRTELTGAKIRVSQVSCPRPSRINDGTLQAPASRYRVGDKAKYKCNTRDFYIERTCLSSGAWSPANSACLDCPYGFIPYEDQCYRYFPLYMDKDGANKHCQKMGAVVANPKNADQNHFIASIRENERIWLGGHKSDTSFKWNDGTPVAWRNWELARKSFLRRDNCMVLEKSELWTDDWCRDKLFHFVCQVTPQNEEKKCVDYLDTCPELVSGIPDGDCTHFPSLQLDCRSSCGLCLSDCKKTVSMTSNNQISVITQRQGFCSWKFQGDGKPGRFIVTVDSFDVKAPDSFTLSLSQTEGYLHKWVGRTYQKTTYVYEDHLHIDFKGQSNTDSRFQVTVRYVKDSDMCYAVKDKGWSYVGKVSYTKSFQTCMPWAQTGHCGHSPITEGDFLDHLEGNYCRNPDDSEFPWCYTTNCLKQTCDVCALEKLEDVGDDCQARKDRGECTMESTDCAKTCQLDQYVTRVSQTRCGFPSQVSQGAFQGPYKSEYEPGDKVVYKCYGSSFTVDRVCLSDGTWSVANTACMGCPLDSFEFHGQCYEFVEQRLNYTNAEKVCVKEGTKIARPKSAKESKFVSELRKTGNRPTDIMWIGAKRDAAKKSYIWNDGTKVDWTNWAERKKVSEREDCVVLGLSSVWHDDWCHDKALNFACQQQSYDQPECKDFLDDCPHRLTLTHKQMCDPDSRMEMLCRKTCGLCPRDCDHNVQLSQEVSSYGISADRRTQSSRYCSWHFTVPEGKKGRFVVDFDEFEVTDAGSKCVDSVEVKDSRYGEPHVYYCNYNQQHKHEIQGDSLYVFFRTIPNSQSHIKAMVTWIDDDSMCYNTNDKGRSYSGDVNYSKSFRSCLPWSQTQHCSGHPLKEGHGNLISHLHGNKCRNPDNSDRPWCFITKKCKKEDCDVCHLEKPYDKSTYCDELKNEGICQSDPSRALNDCAATCNAVPSSQSTNKAIDVTCGSPRAVSGAILNSPKQSKYKVGDVVTYKCSRSNSTVSSVCLTTGQWSDAKTPCLSCPAGWSQFGDKCYKYIEQYLEYVDAAVECKKLSAIVAPAKTKAINDFLHTLRNRQTIWLGIKKSKDGIFYWSDGTSLSWTNWRNPSKPMAKRDNCVLFPYGNTWNDDWCHDKFFPFVCQLDSDAQPDCVDFMESCPDYVQNKGTYQCNAILNNYCRKSCGLC